MNFPESTTVSRGVMWMMIGTAGTIIALLLALVIEGGGAWAAAVERRGLQNEARITALETHFAGIEVELKASADRQQDILDLLKEHMRKDAK